MTRWLVGSVAALSMATAWSAGSVVDGMNASVPFARQLSDAAIENLAAYWNSLAVGGVLKEAVAAAVAARRPQMTFPADFPASFVNYSTQEGAGTKSVTRFYANAVALQAARAGKPLPNGLSKLRE